MLKVAITDPATNQTVATAPHNGTGPVLMTATYGLTNGHFKAASRATAGTTTVVTPRTKDGIVLTDLLHTTDKVNAATATVRFTDGTNNIDILSARVTDAPCNIALSFGGRWAGWQSARIDLITVGVVNATLAIGYYFISEDHTLIFSDWDARRQ